jgi:hypothetical protein
MHGGSREPTTMELRLAERAFQGRPSAFATRDPDAPLNGKSACAYSGQQDDPVADQGTFKGDRTQSK